MKCSIFIYNPQALPCSPKFRIWYFPPTLYTEYKAIQALDTKELLKDTAGHGPPITPYFSTYHIYFLRKYSTFIYNPRAPLESEKFELFPSRRPWTQSTKRSKRDTFFSSDTTGYGLPITKRLAAWYFSIFLLEKYQFLLESILSLFRILKCF